MRSRISLIVCCMTCGIWAIACAHPNSQLVEDSQLPQSQALALALTYELEEYAEDLAALLNACT